MWRGLRSPAIHAIAGLLASAALGAVYAGEREGLTNPYLDDAEAIQEGRSFYRRRCVICHLRRGGRGPNLFASELDDGAFLEVVINGRGDSLMPAFGTRMTVDEVWYVHAYVKSTDHYE